MEYDKVHLTRAVEGIELRARLAGIATPSAPIKDSGVAIRDWAGDV